MLTLPLGSALALFRLCFRPLWTDTTVVQSSRDNTMNIKIISVWSILLLLLPLILSSSIPTLNARDYTAKGPAIPTLNVKDYGARGDGVTDDTKAINDTINDLSNVMPYGELLFPTGQYVISSSLLISLDCSTFLLLTGSADGSSYILGQGSPEEYENGLLFVGISEPICRIAPQVSVSYLTFYTSIPANWQTLPSILLLQGHGAVELQSIFIENSDVVCNTGAIDIVYTENITINDVHVAYLDGLYLEPSGLLQLSNVSVQVQGCHIPNQGTAITVNGVRIHATLRIRCHHLSHLSFFCV